MPGPVPTTVVASAYRADKPVLTNAAGALHLYVKQRTQLGLITLQDSRCCHSLIEALCTTRWMEWLAHAVEATSATASYALCVPECLLAGAQVQRL